MALCVFVSTILLIFSVSRQHEKTITAFNVPAHRVSDDYSGAGYGITVANSWKTRLAAEQKEVFRA